MNYHLRRLALFLGTLLLTSLAPSTPIAFALQTDTKPQHSQPTQLTLEQQEIIRLLKAGDEAHNRRNREGYEAAIKFWEKALQKTQAINEDTLAAMILYKLGRIYCVIGQYERALNYQNLALQIREKLGPQNFIADSLNDLGSTYHDLGLYDKALSYYNRAYTTYKNMNEPDGIAGSLNNIGNVWRDLGQYKEALDYYNRAYAIFEKLGKQEDIAISLGSLGIIYRHLGQYEKALDYQSRALTIFEKMDEPDAMATSLSSLGSIYDYLGQYDKARDYYNRTLLLREKLGNPDSIAKSLSNLGAISIYLGQYEQALDYQNRALHIAEMMDNQDAVATSLYHLGNVYYFLGQPDKVLDYYHRALQLREKLGNPDDIAKSLSNLGAISIYLGQYAQALDYQNRALQIEEKLGQQDAIAGSLNNIGSIYALKKQWGKAEEMYSRSRRAFETLSKQVGDPTQLADLQQTMGHLYEIYAYVLAQQNRPAEALALLESGRARGITHQLFLNRSNYSGLFTKAEADKLKQCLADLTTANNLFHIAQQNLNSCPADQRNFFQKNEDKYEKQVQDAERKYVAYNTFLSQRYPKLREENEEIPVTSNALLALADINPDTLFLTWAMLDDKQTDLYVIGRQEKETLQHFTLDIGEKDLQKMATAWRVSMGVGNRGVKPASAPDEQGEAKQAKALYKVLFEPIEKAGMLANRHYKRFVVVPSGPLLNIPFAALQDANGERLIENYAVSSKVALNTSFWRANPIASKIDMLCIADPIGEATTKQEEIALRRDGFGPLPGARKEGISVAGLFHAKALIGPAAKKAEVLKAISGAKYLHFATHGYLNDKTPFYSGLVLAPEPAGSSDDGVLSAREILNMGLAAKMAVLSACETGRGLEKEGDGLQGLVWAFEAAGCPCVVASQWSVDDSATRDLMLSFYKGVQAGKRKDDALREAMLLVMKTKPSPFYWAAFQIIGDTQPLPKQEAKTP